jgi:sec-independent protein translocase protein TatA
MILAFIGSATDMAFIAMVAIMLFGKRLPEVARQMGRGWAELKKGISGLQSEFNSALMSDTTSSSTNSSSNYNSRQSSNLTYRDPIDDYEEQTAPKFVPPSEPS